MHKPFVWNKEKARRNLEKHGVSFDIVASVFNDPFAICDSDVDHSTLEERWVEMGRASDGRLLVVWYTEDEHCIRIIGARKANRKERNAYEGR